MKIFIETANLDQIEEVNSWGILDGVTTNPTLVAKEGCEFEKRGCKGKINRIESFIYF